MPETALELSADILAGRPALRLVTTVFEVPESLPDLQAQTLELVSQGNTIHQVARELEVSRADITSTEHNLKARFAARNMAATVHKAIVESVLPIEFKPAIETTKRLTSQDIQVLGYFATGGNITQLAKHNLLPVKSVSNLKDRLLKAVGAWSIPHAVRRSHELGVLGTSYRCG